MNLPPARRLASFVEPQVDDRRIDRAWAAVSSRPVRTGLTWKRVALPAMAVAAAAVVALVVGHARTPASALAGLVIESAANRTVTLSEGTSATLHDGARLRFDRVQTDRVDATVERGQVVFDVKHYGARTFVVHAAGIDVLDWGTRFTVDVEGSAVSVSVEEGNVENRPRGLAARTARGGRGVVQRSHGGPDAQPASASARRRSTDRFTATVLGRDRRSGQGRRASLPHAPGAAADRQRGPARRPPKGRGGRLRHPAPTLSQRSPRGPGSVRAGTAAPRLAGRSSRGRRSPQRRDHPGALRSVP